MMLCTVSLPRKWSMRKIWSSCSMRWMRRRRSRRARGSTGSRSWRGRAAFLSPRAAESREADDRGARPDRDAEPLRARHAAFEGEAFVVEGRVDGQRALSIAEARALKTRVGVGARYRVVVDVADGSATT